MMTSMKEMELKELEQVNGGLLVDCGLFEDYLIVDENTGNVLDTKFFIFQAEEAAEKKQVSKFVITEAEYKRRYNQ